MSIWAQIWKALDIDPEKGTIDEDTFKRAGLGSLAQRKTRDISLNRLTLPKKTLRFDRSVLIAVLRYTHTHTENGSKPLEKVKFIILF